MEATTALIVAIITAIGGGSGLAAVLVVVFSYKKYKAEAETIMVGNEKQHKENEQKEMEYVKQSLIELQNVTKAEMTELRKENKVLEQRIDTLNKKLSSLMNWIVCDDHKYRSWLESKLHELDPSLEFPKVADPPSVFGDDFGDEPKDSSDDKKAE